MEKVIGYVKNSFEELKTKVTWPTWEELQSSLLVVSVASLIFALTIWVMDQVFSQVMEAIYSIIA